MKLWSPQSQIPRHCQHRALSLQPRVKFVRLGGGWDIPVETPPWLIRRRMRDFSFPRHAKPWKAHRWHLGILPFWGCSQTRQGHTLLHRGLSNPEVLTAQPAEPFILDPVELLTCLWKLRRGAVVGLSGMTSDHLFPVLENEGDSERLAEVASLLAAGRVPNEIIEALRLGRLTAVRKCDGGVRGIVVGDILRRMEFSLCACFTTTHPSICGKTSWGSPNTSRKGREGSKEIPSCPCSSHWASIRPSFKPKQGCLAMRSCVPSWVTSTSQVCWAGLQKHCGRGTLDPRRHPPPPWQNQSVESWWRLESAWCANWPTRVRQRFLGGEDK